MEVRFAHAGIASYANTSPGEPVVVTEAATLRPPLAVRHLEEGDTRQLVDLAERHAGDVEGAHEVYPFADVGLLEYAAGVGAQFTDGIPNAGLASFAEPGGRGG